MSLPNEKPVQAKPPIILKTEPTAIIAPVVNPVLEPIIEPTTSGTVVAKSNVPVGTVSTQEEIKAVIEEKKLHAGGLMLTKEVSSLIDRIAATKNQVAINNIEEVKAYMLAMAPGRTMTQEDGSRNQVTFFRTIRSIIEFTGAEFQLSFVTLLRLFDEFKDDVFHERYVFRFMDHVALPQEERWAYERIVNLLKIAAPVQGRKEALRQVNFQKTLQHSFSDEGRRKVLSFFNV